MKGKLAQIGRRIVAVANRLGVARILSIVLVVAVLVYGCGFLVSYLSIPQQTLTDLPQKGLAPSLGTIRPKSGEVQVASEGNLTLYLDTATLCLRIHDAASGRDFYSMSRDDLVPERAHSPLTLSYRSTGGATGEWDAYTYAIARDQYEIDRIENGVRFKLTLSQGKSYAVNDYLPQKISTERYQTALLDKIDALAEQGVDDKTINSYKKVLNQYYGHDEEAGYHFVKYSGTPSKGMVSILIEMVEAIGYTQDDIVADNGEYNIVSTFSNSAEFVVYMEHTLEDGALVVNVPTYEISCNKEDYRVQKLSVYPAFNCADESKNEGYLFVPDGAGALFPMDSGITTYGDYTRPIYDNTRYGNLYNIRGYKEDTPMPVFGMYHTGGDKTGSGFFAVIESGAELAWYATAIKSAPGQEGGHVYNAAFATFEVMQSASVRVFGPFASQTNSYLVTADPAKMDCTVRYYVVGEDADYATYADIYRNYLVGGDASKLNYNNEAKLYINLLGAVTLKDSILGVPYDRDVSMTTYTQASEILAQLSDVSAVYNYKWGLNGGRANGWGGEAEPVEVNGSMDELQALLAQSKPGNEIFMEASLMRVHTVNGTLNTGLHMTVGWDGDPALLSDRYYPDNTLDLNTPFATYYMLHPTYLTATVDGFLGEATYIPNVSLTDFGFAYYASYGSRNAATAAQATQQVVNPALEKIAAQKAIALSNPNADKLLYCTYATDISREATMYGTAYAAVPFRQLVMNGITQYTTLNVNMAQSSPRYFLLQALELGSIPQYTVSAEGVDELLKAGIHDYYSVEFADLKDDIVSFYEEYKAARTKIGSGEIVDHEMIGSNVFRTTWANGTQVIVNYGLVPAEVEGHTLDALGYLIVEG